MTAGVSSWLQAVCRACVWLTGMCGARTSMTTSTTATWSAQDSSGKKWKSQQNRFSAFDVIFRFFFRSYVTLIIVRFKTTYWEGRGAKCCFQHLTLLLRCLLGAVVSLLIIMLSDKNVMPLAHYMTLLFINNVQTRGS